MFLLLFLRYFSDGFLGFLLSFSKKSEENGFFGNKSPKSVILKSEVRKTNKKDEFRDNFHQNNENFPQKNSNFIDIFLNNTKKPDFYDEKLQENSSKIQKENSRNFQMENTNYRNKSPKKMDFNVYLPDTVDNSHNFAKKSKESLSNPPKNQDFTTFHHENPKKTFTKINRNLGFQPVLPENIENVTNYLHPVENRKDFSQFGLNLLTNTNNITKNPINTNNLTNINNITNITKNPINANNNITNNDNNISVFKRNSGYKSFSPFSREIDQSLKKSRSSKMNYDKEEEELQSNSSKKIKERNNDNTFHNASISVLNRIDFTLKSFASNRPEFFSNNVFF